MTSSVRIGKRDKSYYTYQTALCIFLAAVMIIFGKEMRTGIYDGLVFSFTTIIPTLFPFFILSDLWSTVFKIRQEGLLSRLFERFFSINGQGLSAWLSGMICGFPVGIKVARELYDGGDISLDELEDLSGFVNNPSVAFVISGVGVGFLGSIKLGVLLYISLTVSAVAVGVIFRRNRSNSHKTQNNSRQSFNLSKSIINAGTTSVAVVSCISAFSGILSLLSSIINNGLIICLISPFLEVSNAIRMICGSELITYHIRLSLIAFSLGFSGLSVHLQAFAFLPPELSRARYLLMKLTQGIISSVLTYFTFLIFK